MSEEQTKLEEKSLLEKGLELYEQKAPYEDIIPFFEQAALEHPRDSSAYTCLAWLYLLKDEKEDRQKGLHFAQQATKMDRRNAQAQANLVLAMLMSGRTGIRKEVEKIYQRCASPEDLKEIQDNLKEALQRKDDFAEAQKLLSWLE